MSVLVATGVVFLSGTCLATKSGFSSTFFRFLLSLLTGGLRVNDGLPVGEFEGELLGVVRGEARVPLFVFVGGCLPSRDILSVCNYQCNRCVGACSKTPGSPLLPTGFCT